MWEKIVLNLVSNAFKFTTTGGITVRTRSDGTNFVLEVSDTGIGIPEGELDAIFERFHRAEEARGRSFEGTGIGLALVKELVEIHGGSVSVGSELGKGSLFTVRLRLGSAHLQQERVRAQSGSSSGHGNADAFVQEAMQWLPQPASIQPEGELALPDPAGAVAASATILLADDNADMRAYVERLLNLRFAVTAVADGQAAIDALAKDTYDLALLDVMMPARNGFEVLAHVREHMNGALPVILLSARAGEAARIEGLRAGADDYLVKPFGARELLARVEGTIRLAHQRQEAAELQRQSDVNIELAREEARLKGEMIAEINHRVKNNLQLLSSLIGLTAKNLADPAAREALQSLKERVVNLGAVHALLYQGDNGWVDAAEFVSTVAQQLVSAYGADAIELSLAVMPAQLATRKAVTLGLLLNEAVLNALKHAFDDQQTGRVSVELSNDPGSITLTVQDNGRGYAGPRAGSSGLRLMETFARQLRGSVSIEAEGGTKVICTFPKESDENSTDR
jgi:two-component sensor histidine kinase